MGLRRTEPSNVDGALGRSPVHPIRRNGSAHVPAGTDPQACCLPADLLGRSSCVPVEEFSGFQHSVQDNGELAATATAAHLKPMRSRSLRLQSRMALSTELRVRMTDAASYRRFPTWRSHAWRYGRCTPPDRIDIARVVRPSHTPTVRDVRKLAGSSAAVARRMQ